MAQPIRFEAVIEKIEKHDNDVSSYQLRSEKRLPRFLPGQFIHLTIDDYDPSGFWPESRVFSVANSVSDHRTIDLTVSRQGGYTNRILDELHQGDTVWAKGPYGDFRVGDSHGCSRVVLIAGGTGVTPFSAFMGAVIEQGKLPVDKVILFYGARTAGLLIYRELAERCAAKVTGFHSHYFIEEHAVDNACNSVVGRLDIANIVTELGSTGNTAFFLSGPKVMIDLFRGRLIDDFGVSNERVLVDAWD